MLQAAIDDIEDILGATIDNAEEQLNEQQETATTADDTHANG